MTTIDEKIEKLELKLKQEKARKALMDARKKSAEIKQAKATADKKKFLLGAFILAQIEEAQTPIEWVEFNGQSFANWLTRDSDRAAFGLSPIPKLEGQNGGV